MKTDANGMLIDPLFHDLSIRHMELKRDIFRVLASDNSKIASFETRELKKIAIRNFTDDSIILNVFLGNVKMVEKSGKNGAFFHSLLNYSGEDIDLRTIEKFVSSFGDCDLFDFHLLHGGRILGVCNGFKIL